MQEASNQLEPNSVNHIHIILIDNGVVNAFCIALAPGAEIQVHILASDTFCPV